MAVEGFIKSLYEIQRGYNLDEDGNNDDCQPDKSICSAGAFNKIAQGLESIHPDVTIEYVTIAGANFKIKNSRLVLDKFIAYFSGENLTESILAKLIHDGFDSEYIKRAWEEIKSYISEDMHEYKVAFNGNVAYESFIDACIWALDMG